LLILSKKIESHARKNAWLTSLRRHYPHQVQRVRLNDVSAKRLPRIFFLGQNKTHANEVNDMGFAL
jgi:hypothetical protein